MYSPPAPAAAAALTALPTEPYVGGGESVLSRYILTGSFAVVPGTVEFTYFRAQVTEDVKSLSLLVATNRSTGAVTLAKLGLYSVDDAGALTLMTKTASVPTLMDAAGSFIRNTPTLDTVTKTAGKLYACAWLITGTGNGNLLGSANLGSNPNAIVARRPRLFAQLTGQVDMPAGPIADAALTNIYHGPWFETRVA